MRWTILPAIVLIILLIGCAQVEPADDVQNNTGLNDKNLTATTTKYQLKEEVDIPENIRIAAEEYFKNKIGPDEIIILNKTTLKKYCACNKIINVTSEKRYCVRYLWDWSQHGIDKKKELDVGFNTDGTLYCIKNDILDCINHPEQCPPFNITEEQAKKIFEEECGQSYTHMGLVHVNNTPYWRFDNSRHVKCTSPPCPHTAGMATYYGYVNAQTGKAHFEGAWGSNYPEYNEC